MPLTKTPDTMLKLETLIANWRQQMLAAGINTPAPMNELEIHLREDVERQLKSGINEQQAFETAMVQIGQVELLKMEFKKNDAENWNRPLAWAAWVSFVASFFLPTYRDGRGWQCAGLSATTLSWSDCWHGNWPSIHLALLTLANLLMIVSPFLLARFSLNLHFVKWWRAFNFLALSLVWSFLVMMLAHTDRNDLKIGCYVWAMSFLLLFVSTLKIRSQKIKLQKEQYV